MKKILSLLLVSLLLFTVVSCGNKSSNQLNIDENAKKRKIVDMLGREVEIPTKINSIICTGNNALRMVSYLQATDMLVGVEETDLKYEKSTKRDYAHVYYDKFKDLPLIGKGGGSAYTAYPEKILEVKPDVILTCYVQEAAEQLQKETGIPVVSIRNASANFIDEDFFKALTLTADIINKQQRCEELLLYINECKADLDKRSEVFNKTKVYAGAITYNGAKGFAGTYANFGPFMAIKANNVADESGEKSAFQVDLEKVLVWDPNIIFLDPGNMNLVNEEYKANPGFFNSLSAVKNGQVYTMPSFNNYSTNITYCLMDAYFAGKIIYSSRFSDIDIKTKGNEILNKFLGKAYFDEMKNDGLYYGKLTLGK
ncbi:MAG: iron ABC transporter substrate-binding protein [Erysipelotrichaceae bacterium]